MTRTAAEAEAYNLLIAARSGDQETLSLMLTRGLLDTNPTDANNLTPLSVAVQKGHTEVARMLLAARADTEVKDKSGNWTALHHAASEGSAALVDILLDAKADANALDNVKDTPLNEAVREGHLACARLLLYSRASVLVRSHGGNHALALAQRRDTDLRKTSARTSGQEGSDLRDAAELLSLCEAAAKAEEVTPIKLSQTAVDVGDSSADATPSAISSSDSSATAAAPAGAQSPQREITYTERRRHGSVDFSAGDSVRVQMLQSRADLNGRVAKVLDWDSEGGRYRIRIQGSADGNTEAIKVKPQCLEPVLDDSESGYEANY